MTTSSSGRGRQGEGEREPAQSQSPDPTIASLGWFDAESDAAGRGFQRDGRGASNDLRTALQLVGLLGFEAWSDPALPAALRNRLKRASTQEQRSAVAWLLQALSEEAMHADGQARPRSS